MRPLRVVVMLWKLLLVFMVSSVWVWIIMFSDAGRGRRIRLVRYRVSADVRPLPEPTTVDREAVRMVNSLVTYMKQGVVSYADEVRTASRKPESTAVNIKKKRQKILLYGGFWGAKDWEVGLGSAPFERLQCKVRQCEFTSDKSALNSSDAVLFHIQELTNAPPPKHRPEQRWVFFMLESPAWSKNLRYAQPEWRSTFNWTMTYRLDSDVRLLYGSITNARRPKRSAMSRGTVRKKGLVAWMVSNSGAGVESRRLEYAKELQKYIPVDIYGRLGNLSCPKVMKDNDKSCTQMLNSTYMFYLAFENNYCKDYVTEKLYKVLPLDVIPVVRGAAQYDRYVPYKWYINADDFTSPKDLAKFLYHLVDHPAEYQSYFHKRHLYDVRPYLGIRDLPSWCDLCEKLHTDTTRSHYKDIRTWWGKQDCHRPKVTWK